MIHTFENGVFRIVVDGKIRLILSHANLIGPAVRTIREDDPDSVVWVARILPESCRR